MKQITSINNPIIKFYSSLNRHSVRMKEQLFLIEGDILLRECRQAGVGIKAVLVNRDRPALLQEMAAAFPGETEIFACDERVLTYISALKTPQDLICVGKIPQNEPQFNPQGRYIACENIQDPGNAGAILRSAAAFGMDGVLFCGGCDLFSAKVLRGSMGAVFKVPVWSYASCADMSAALKKNGIRLFAAAADRTAQQVDGRLRKCATAVLIGNEGNGLSKEAQLLCDETVFIPIEKTVESLNAAVAASIFMWEMTR